MFDAEVAMLMFLFQPGLFFFFYFLLLWLYKFGLGSRGDPCLITPDLAELGWRWRGIALAKFLSCCQQISGFWAIASKLFWHLGLLRWVGVGCMRYKKRWGSAGPKTSMSHNMYV